VCIDQAGNDYLSGRIGSTRSRVITLDIATLSDRNDLSVFDRNSAIFDHAAIYIHRNDRSADDYQINTLRL
jgi:hypothetical protein